MAGLIDRARDSVIGAVRGAGDIVDAVRAAVQGAAEVGGNVVESVVSGGERKT